MKHRGGQIELPWPHKILWPNGSVGNRHHKSREFAKHKAWAWAAAKEARLVAPDGRIPILFTFCPKPTGPAPDKDNALSSAKAYANWAADPLRKL